MYWRWPAVDPHSTSLSSPPSWMTWPIDAWFWALMKHCLLHSISCSRSRHIFICSMLAPWLSLTIFCFSRNFWSPQMKIMISKKTFKLQTYWQKQTNQKKHILHPHYCSLPVSVPVHMYAFWDNGPLGTDMLKASWHLYKSTPKLKEIRCLSVVVTCLLLGILCLCSTWCLFVVVLCIP